MCMIIYGTFSHIACRLWFICWLASAAVATSRLATAFASTSCWHGSQLHASTKTKSGKRFSGCNHILFHSGFCCQSTQGLQILFCQGNTKAAANGTWRGDLLYQHILHPLHPLYQWTLLKSSNLNKIVTSKLSTAFFPPSSQTSKGLRKITLSHSSHAHVQLQANSWGFYGTSSCLTSAATTTSQLALLYSKALLTT